MRDMTNFELPENLVFRTEDILALNGLKFTAQVNPALLDNACDGLGEFQNLRLKADLAIGKDSILVWGRLKWTRKCECANCLKEVSGKYSEEFEETLSRNDEIIDIMNILRQVVMLASGMRVLCKEECKGLCPVCGTDLNERTCGCTIEHHSPFAALKNYKKKSDSK
ncbi:MAG: DUF177 domain-containing protein [Elusimicrobiaceae bacterium]|jgi:uncharacterized protein